MSLKWKRYIKDESIVLIGTICNPESFYIKFQIIRIGLKPEKYQVYVGESKFGDFYGIKLVNSFTGSYRECKVFCRGRVIVEKGKLNA